MTKTSKNDTKLDCYISQAEAARIRGVSKQAIADLIRRGRLSKVTVAGRALVLRAEVEAYIALPKLGRPSKKTAIKNPATRAKPRK